MDEEPRRLEPRDHAAKLADATVLESRRRVLVAREVVVVELERDLSADAQIELTRGEPFRALVGLGDIGPHALNRAGQQALELDGAGLDHGDGSVGSFAFPFRGSFGRFSCSLDRILRAQRRLEVVEARIPELARAAHPLREVVERLRLERQEMVPTGDAPAYEARALEEADVFRHRVERDVEGRGD